MAYAEGTEVPVERSRAELERLLNKHDADEIIFRSGKDGIAGVFFRMEGRYVKLDVRVPPVNEFLEDPAGRRRAPGAATAAREKEERRLWRVLLLHTKAKFEAIEADISDFKREFLADTLLPDNSTVGDFMEGQVERAYKDGSMPSPLALLLPAPKDNP